MILTPYDKVLSSGNRGSVSTYQNMLLDPTIRIAYNYVRLGVARRIGAYVSPSTEQMDYVETALMPAIRRALPHMLSAVYYGSSLSELIYEADGKDLKLKRIFVAHPQLWWSGAYIVNDGEVTGVRVNGSKVIPVIDNLGNRQLVIITYAPGIGSDSVYGTATARVIYNAWFIKTRLAKFEALGLESFGIPSVVVKSDRDSQEILRQYQTLGAAKAIAVGTNESVDVISTAKDKSPYHETLRRYDEEILSAFYLPSLILKEGRYGTRAQAETHLSVYELAEESITQAIAEVLVNQVIYPSLVRQYGGYEPGEIEIGESSTGADDEETT